MRKETWKNVSYPNEKPCWQKPCWNRDRVKIKPKKKTQLERVLANLNYDKLATLGKPKQENISKWFK